jgi:signal transduction histidine kinase
MEKKKRQRFFIAKELQISVSLIVIWSLLAGILFAYITKELGAGMEHGLLSFIAVFAGYVIIVIVFAMFFAHRFLGPFERLKMEMRLILGGDYSRRLCIRKNDDIYIRSFISDVNKLLNIFEGKCINKEKFRKEIDSELLHLMSLIEKDSVSRQKLREAMLSFHEKIETMLKD